FLAANIKTCQTCPGPTVLSDDEVRGIAADGGGLPSIRGVFVDGWVGRPRQVGHPSVVHFGGGLLANAGIERKNRDGRGIEAEKRLRAGLVALVAVVEMDFRGREPDLRQEEATELGAGGGGVAVVLIVLVDAGLRGNGGVEGRADQHIGGAVRPALSG